MKQKIFFTLIIVFSVLNLFAQTGKVIKNLTTGINNATNTAIPYGANDDTWTVRWPSGSGGLGYKPTIVCTNLGGAWAADGCGRWITHKLEAGSYDPEYGGVAGKYVYRTHFELNLTCLTWVKINLSKLGADNRARTILINGHPYSVGPLSWATTSWYNPLKSTAIDIDLSHLVSGDNIFEIEVSNDEAYEGLFICGDISQNYCP